MLSGLAATLLSHLPFFHKQQSDLEFTGILSKATPTSLAFLKGALRISPSQSLPDVWFICCSSSRAAAAAVVVVLAWGSSLSKATDWQVRGGSPASLSPFTSNVAPPSNPWIGNGRGERSRRGSVEKGGVVGYPPHFLVCWVSSPGNVGSRGWENGRQHLVHRLR